MSGTWKAETSEVDDPLLGYHKKPIISRGSPHAKYLGRVIVELWDDNGARDDADGITISADAVNGNHAQLIERIAVALLARVQRRRPFEGY